MLASGDGQMSDVRWQMSDGRCQTDQEVSRGSTGEVRVMVQSRAFGALPAVACPQHRVGARLVGLEGPPGGAMPASGICP